MLPLNTRPNVGAICISNKGVAITTGGTAVDVAIPDTSYGPAPTRIRLAATAACYARLGTPGEGTAAVTDAGAGILVVTPVEN